MKPTGHIFFQDEYRTQYRLDWETIGGSIDFTSTMFQPFVWGEPDQGYINDGTVYRRGVVTVERQILRLTATGYEVIAEGSSQYISTEPTNYPCQESFGDPFTYHLDRPASDEVGAVVTVGPRWADYDDPDAVWGDLDSSGDPVEVTGGTPLEFIDVWG